MSNIFNYLKPNNSQTEENLARIDAFIESPKFLQGLGSEALSLDYDDDFLVTGSIVEAAKLFISQEAMHQEKPWPYQVFNDLHSTACKVTEEASHKLSDEERKLVFPGQGSLIFKYLCDVEERRLNILRKELKIIESNQDLNLDQNVVGGAINLFFEGGIFELLDSTLYSAYLSEFHQSSFWNRVCVYFEAGGLPCGWLGGKSLEEGGDPHKCLVMYHRNIKGKPREVLYPDLKDYV